MSGLRWLSIGRVRYLILPAALREAEEGTPIIEVEYRVQVATGALGDMTDIRQAQNALLRA